MTLDTKDPRNHGRPLWAVYGGAAFPQLLCCQLLAYTREHQLLSVGTRGPNVCIWGYSVYRCRAGFRTLGIDVDAWSSRHDFAEFYDDQEEALGRLREMTRPKAGAR
jgi:hypothetical protein